MAASKDEVLSPNQTIAPDTTEPGSNLDKLPTEVRLKIYQHVFANAELINRYDQYFRSKNLHLSILRSSHKIRNEALPVLGHMLEVSIVPHRAETMTLHLSPHFLGEIRNLELPGEGRHCPHWGLAIDLIDRHLPGLQVLRIQNLEGGFSQIKELATALDTATPEEKQEMFAMLSAGAEEVFDDERTARRLHSGGGPFSALLQRSDRPFQIKIQVAFASMRIWLQNAKAERHELKVTVDFDTLEVGEIGELTTERCW